MVGSDSAGGSRSVVGLDPAGGSRSVVEPVETLRTARLSLPLITPAQAADLREGNRHPSFAPGFPRPDDIDAASLASGTPWGPRLVVRAHDGLVCGTAGFFGPPDQETEVPEVEVGYGLVPEARGRGVASEVLAALLALADEAAVRVRASVAPDNAASLRVLAKSGFTQLRSTTPEGELVMVRPVRREHG